jgi:hypothetical protein
MAFADYSKNLLHEYFYARFCELEDKEEKILLGIRHKRGLIVLCDELRRLETEKHCYQAIYEDLKRVIS